MKELVKQLKKDKELRETWIANVAMSFVDNYNSYKRKSKKTKLNSTDIHSIANNAAEYFTQLLCDEIKFPEGR